MSRPELEIDWQKAEEFMMAGSPGTEIAAYFGMHPDTFYKKVEKHYQMGFSALLQEKKSKGEVFIRAKQYAKALGLTDTGDNTLLIWLGKTRLNQREQDNSHVPPKDLQVDTENNQMEENHKLRQRISELEAQLDNQSKTRSEL